MMKDTGRNKKENIFSFLFFCILLVFSHLPNQVSRLDRFPSLVLFIRIQMLTDVLKKGRKETLSYNIDARVLVTLITLDVANKLTVGPRCFSIELSRFDSNNGVSYRDLSSGNEVNVAVSSRR